jgi:hypothetical protein
MILVVIGSCALPLCWLIANKKAARNAADASKRVNSMLGRSALPGGVAFPGLS